MDKWLINKTKILNDNQPSTSEAKHHDHEDTLSEAPKTDIQRQNNKRKANWTRKYCDEYLRFGFIAGGSQNNLPVCVICNEQLSNECMKPSKLKRHLDTIHSEYSHKPIQFFADKKKELIAAQKTMKNALFPHQSNKNLTLTAFEISKLIAETGYPYSAGEKLILPALKIVANNLCGIKEKSLFSAIPLSNNTVKRRIDDIAKHLEEELVAKVKKSKLFLYK